MARKHRKFLLLFAQDGILAVTWVDQSFIGQDEELLGDRLNDLFESGGGSRLTGASRKEGIARKELLTAEKTHTALGMTWSVDNLQAQCAEIHQVTILQS